MKVMKQANDVNIRAHMHTCTHAHVHTYIAAIKRESSAYCTTLQNVVIFKVFGGAQWIEFQDA